MQGGGTIQPMVPKYTSQLNLPMSSVNISKIPSTTSQPGSTTGWGMGDGSSSGIGTASAIGSAAGSIFSALASANNTNVAPDTATQQTVDSLLSNIPFYSVGNALGDWAATDYKSIGTDPNDAKNFGKLSDPDRYDVASTIGGFLGPDNLISGLSGEGWTAGERRAKIEEKTAPQRAALIKQKNEQWRATNQAENPGRFYDTNQMMMAAYGGPLNQPMQNMQQMGQPNQMPQVTEYNTGGTHEQNPNQGVPVDSEGNPATISGGKAVALTEAGEVAFRSKSGEIYVFSSRLFAD